MYVTKPLLLQIYHGPPSSIILELFESPFANDRIVNTPQMVYTYSFHFIVVLALYVVESRTIDLLLLHL